jgi:RNA polymerase sigma-70 factor (ECF subfamily)
MCRAAELRQNAWAHVEGKVTVSADADDSAPLPLGGEGASDRELVDAARTGSREAFDLLVLRHQRGVYHLCRRYADGHEDAADLTQEVFVRAYRGLKRFKGEAAFRTWLYRIAVNVCLNRVAATARVANRVEPLDTLDPPDLMGERPDEPLLREERGRRIRSAIAQLPPKQRSTLILRVYEELSHEEVARVLGSSVGACKANLFHAIRKLRKLLQP